MGSKIYYGGDIITLEENLYCDAVLTQDGIIKKVGKLQDLLKLKTDKTVMKDLKGLTMMPSFIDAHSHITGYAKSLTFCNLSECYSFEDIKNTLISFKNKSKMNEDDFVVGFGYDQNSLAEKRHPDKFVLDDTGIKNPILISHVSGHMGVINQKALDILNLKTKDVEDKDGYLEESAFIKIASNLKMPTPSNNENPMKEAQKIYASYGITTAQDGLIKMNEMEMLKNSEKYIDIVAFLDLKSSKQLLKDYQSFAKKYKDNLKIGGYKIFLDGSPQGKTAWMTKPYENSENNYCGYSIYKDEEVLNFIISAIEDDVQILAHCNGDAAAEQYIKCMKDAVKLTGKKPKRPVMIHSQLLRKDLIKELKDLNIIPSYFVAHTYFWGDIHIQNFGERGYNISPLGSTKKEGVIFTLHQDSPVIEPDMLMTVWCAVSRTTKNNVKLNQEECVDVIDALKAITINAAYQYFEEDKKGSIKEEKFADFVILSENPLKSDIDKIKDIEIIETIKNDESIYKSI